MFLSTKKLVFIFLMIFSLFEAQQKSKDFSHILRSNSIYEIDAYLRVAHPDEPKRSVLKPRLIKLLKEYIQNAHPADQRVKDFQEKLALLRRKPSTRISFEEMNEIIRQKQIAKFKEELQAKGKIDVAQSKVATPNPQKTGNVAVENPEEEE